MELIKVSFEKNIIPENIVACIGQFDGVHIAHQALIEQVISIGKQKKLKTGIITFDPHPDFILNKTLKEEYITPFTEKKQIIEKFNVDYLIVINFSYELSKLTYDEFYNKFLKKINTIVVGYDFKFGYKGIGNVDILKKMHNDVIVVDKITVNNNKVGTKNIINYLKMGDMNNVLNMLGRFYIINGTVIKGSQIGRKIGYPTANINIIEKYSIIKKGVYAVRVLIDNKYYLGIANYGFNPSFNQVDIPRLEVHIFEFNNDLYGKTIGVEFVEHIRDEIKFDSIDDFLLQLKKDCNYCTSKYGGKYETINCRSNGLGN